EHHRGARAGRGHRGRHRPRRPPPGQRADHRRRLAAPRHLGREDGQRARSHRQHLGRVDPDRARRLGRAGSPPRRRPRAARRLRRRHELGVGRRAVGPDVTDGRVVLVTGGAKGIGLACARAFVDAGERVAVTYRSVSPPDDLGEAVLAVPCDVTDGESVEAAFTTVEEKLGAVEVLVSNAGITADTLVPRMSDGDFTSVVDTNLAGGFRVAKRALKRMMRARRGRIIFISSVVGATGQAGQANYAASKAGLVGLARSLAREYASRAIT